MQTQSFANTQRRGEFILVQDEEGLSLASYAIAASDEAFGDGLLLQMGDYDFLEPWAGVKPVEGILLGPHRGPGKAAYIARRATVYRHLIHFPEGYEEAAALGLAALGIVVRPAIEYTPAPPVTEESTEAVTEESTESPVTEEATEEGFSGFTLHAANIMDGVAFGYYAAGPYGSYDGLLVPFQTGIQEGFYYVPAAHYTITRMLPFAPDFFKRRSVALMLDGEEVDPANWRVSRGGSGETIANSFTIINDAMAFEADTDYEIEFVAGELPTGDTVVTAGVSGLVGTQTGWWDAGPGVGMGSITGARLVPLFPEARFVYDSAGAFVVEFWGRGTADGTENDESTFIPMTEADVAGKGLHIVGPEGEATLDFSSRDVFTSENNTAWWQWNTAASNPDVPAAFHFVDGNEYTLSIVDL